jgi:hypothetical protein
MPGWLVEKLEVGFAWDFECVSADGPALAGSAA